MNKNQTATKQFLFDIFRFKLDNSPIETTVSPGSNSSSEQNEAHSVISSPPVPSPQIIPSSPVTSTAILSTPTPLIAKVPLSSITLAPLVTRPPLPPRPQVSVDSLLSPSPRDNSQRNSVSGSDRESCGMYTYMFIYL